MDVCSSELGEFKYLWVLFLSDGWSVRWSGGFIACVVPECCGEEVVRGKAGLKFNDHLLHNIAGSS